jgi:asparagine synthase (glutamine-hydrolysing)
VDLIGLDQILTFPGLISPRTMFKGIHSLRPGHYLLVKDGEAREVEYWDLDYPTIAEAPPSRGEREHAEELLGHLARAVRLRLHADVPVGLYLSGGLDSSLIAGLAARATPGERRRSFSISFQDREIDEARHRALLLSRLGAEHEEIPFDWPEISAQLEAAVVHAECPLKETYNTASLSLSARASAAGVKAILTGEGADELFAGYVGYRFDQRRREIEENQEAEWDLDAALEAELRQRVWGSEEVFYERDLYAQGEVKRALYSAALNEAFDELDCLNAPLVNQERLRGRHPLHQRSYLDFKLRLADHLLADHGDRMAMAHAIEARFPFLDRDVIDCARRMPPGFKLKGYVEKYIVKQAAKGIVPDEIVGREKFAFHAPGSPYLLKQRVEWIEDLLSFDTIRRQGYFNPETVERLKTQYRAEGFRLNLPFDSDLLVIVLTFGVFLEQFKLA